jgi:hypothetical protein
MPQTFLRWPKLLLYKEAIGTREYKPDIVLSRGVYLETKGVTATLEKLFDNNLKW